MIGWGNCRTWLVAIAWPNVTSMQLRHDQSRHPPSFFLLPGHLKSREKRLAETLFQAALYRWSPSWADKAQGVILAQGYQWRPYTPGSPGPRDTFAGCPGGKCWLRLKADVVLVHTHCNLIKKTCASVGFWDLFSSKGLLHIYYNVQQWQTGKKASHCSLRRSYATHKQGEIGLLLSRA